MAVTKARSPIHANTLTACWGTDTCGAAQTHEQSTSRFCSAKVHPSQRDRLQSTKDIPSHRASGHQGESLRSFLRHDAEDAKYHQGLHEAVARVYASPKNEGWTAAFIKFLSCLLIIVQSHYSQFLHQHYPIQSPLLCELTLPHE